MFIIDFRNKIVSEYRFSVMGNNNVDVVRFYSAFTQYASNTSIYLKVESVDNDYVDKIAIASENISIEEDTLVCKWTMGIVSTQCKKLRLQLQFEQGENIIAQTGIVNLTLADTINVDELIPVIYPQVLKELQNQIDTLKAESYASASMSYANDTLSMVFKNKDNETLTSLQVSIPTKNKMEVLEITEQMTIEEAYAIVGDKPFIDYDLKIVKLRKYDETRYLVEVWATDRFGYATGQHGDYQLSVVISDSVEYTEYITSENFDTYANGKVDKTSEDNKVYATNNSGEQITIDVDYGITNEGKIVRRSGNSGETDQIYVPLTPTQNGHATSKKYVDDLVQTIKENHIVPVNTSTYPTLNDFLASTGEEGNIYIYPKDTSDLSKGYLMYVWEGNAWVYLGDTNIDLSGYPTKSGNETISGEWTFDSGFRTEYIKDKSGNNRIRIGSGELYCYANYLPDSNNVRDLGSSSYKWKDLYVGGKITFGSYLNATSDFDFYVAGTHKIRLGTTTIRPATNNSLDLGNATYKWRNLYVGRIYGATYDFAVDSAYALLYGSYTTNNALTELSYTLINVCSKSADTTFTLASAPTGCYPEYKALITNSGASSIVLTFTGVSTILCNDDNIAITNATNSTLVLPSGVSIECSILNGKMVAINFASN